MSKTQSATDRGEGIVTARTSAAVDGVHFIIHRGDTFAPDDPIVLAHRGLFLDGRWSADELEAMERREIGTIRMAERPPETLDDRRRVL